MRQVAFAPACALAAAALLQACQGGPIASHVEESEQAEVSGARVGPLGPVTAPPEVGVWETQSGGPGARAGHAMAFDARRGKVVLFGGEVGATLLGDTWEWDGSRWAHVCSSSSCSASAPPARYAAAMVYDSERGVTVLFGGEEQSGVLGDTWEWDGASWRNACASGCASSPLPVSGHAMAYDPAHGTILFGGTNCTAGRVCALSSDTWSWDGTTWTSHAVAKPPSARAGHSMAFLPGAHPATVLFGGVNGAALSDTWTWDGAAWTEACATCAPPARAYGALAYDATRAKLVLFGGTSAPADTWDWDGSSWTQLATGAAPSARNSLALAYDANRRRMILFGGEGGGQELGDTWDLYRYAGGCSTDANCETSICAMGVGVCCQSACAVCETCATGTCTTVTNATDPSCSGACDESGRCLEGNGAACASPEECASTFCADGVCCDHACTDDCRACTRALTGGADGACLPAKMGSDPHDDCPDEGACSCGANGQCDGNGACQRYQPPTACACGDERRALFGYQCDGFGVCAPPLPDETACDREGALAFADGGGRDCTPYRCTGFPSPHCGTSCASNDDCAAPATCTGEHTCTPPPTSATPGAAGCSAAPRSAPGGGEVYLALLPLGAVRRRRSSPGVLGGERSGRAARGGGCRG